MDQRYEVIDMWRSASIWLFPIYFSGLNFLLFPCWTVEICSQWMFPAPMSHWKYSLTSCLLFDSSIWLWISAGLCKKTTKVSYFLRIQDAAKCVWVFFIQIYPNAKNCSFDLNLAFSSASAFVCVFDEAHSAKEALSAAGTCSCVSSFRVLLLLLPALICAIWSPRSGWIYCVFPLVWGWFIVFFDLFADAWNSCIYMIISCCLSLFIQTVSWGFY